MGPLLLAVHLICEHLKSATLAVGEGLVVHGRLADAHEKVYLFRVVIVQQVWEAVAEIFVLRTFSRGQQPSVTL